MSTNGIGAIKMIRSTRKWAYETFGDEHMIEIVAMATPEDLNVNAEFIRMADTYIEVPGGSNSESFLLPGIAVYAGW
jgi:acetyl-CoA carboxylase/biotin carboxylase 1